VNPADQQLRGGVVRRQVDRTPQLGHRLAILLLLEHAAAAIEMEGGELALLTLGRVHDRLIRTARPRPVEIGAQTLEIVRHADSLRRRLCVALFVARRELARQIPFPGGLDRASRCLQRARQDVVRIGVGHLAPDGFAQPVDRRLVVPLQRVGVAEVELIVGVAWIGIGGAREVIGRRARLAVAAAAQLGHPEVVEYRREIRRRRRRGLQDRGIEQFRERGRGLGVVLHLQQRDARPQLRAPGFERAAGHRLHRRERGGVVVLFVPHVPEGDPRPIERRKVAHGGVEEGRLGGGALRDQALDVVLERAGRRLRRRRRNPRRTGREPPGEPVENREQIPQRAALVDGGLQPSDVHPHAARLDDQLVALDSIGAADDVRGAENLSDLDRRGAAQRGRRGQVQLIVGADALGPGDRRQAAGVELVGEQDRRRLAEPAVAILPLRVLERKNQDPRSGRGRLVDGTRRRGGPRRVGCLRPGRPIEQDERNE
jgi:hypothetical protein